MRKNVLADSLKSVNEAEKRPNVRSSSHLWGCIGRFYTPVGHRAGETRVNLTGRLNKCGAVSPRFAVQLKDLEKWQKTSVGFVVLT